MRDAPAEYFRRSRRLRGHVRELHAALRDGRGDRPGWERLGFFAPLLFAPLLEKLFGLRAWLSNGAWPGNLHLFGRLRNRTLGED